MTKEYIEQQIAEAKKSAFHSIMILDEINSKFSPDLKDDNGKDLEFERNLIFEAKGHLREAVKELNK